MVTHLVEGIVLVATFEFTPPPTPEAITETLLLTTSDDILESVLLNYVLMLQDRDPQIAADLPSGLQAHYVAFVLDGEVLNGGFNQLLFNSPELAEVAPEALTYLEMPAAAAIAQRAWQLYEEVRPRLEAAAEADTIEAFMATYDESPFGVLDSAYANRESDWRLTSVSGLLPGEAQGID